MFVLCLDFGSIVYTFHGEDKKASVSASLLTFERMRGIREVRKGNCAATGVLCILTMNARRKERGLK